MSILLRHFPCLQVVKLWSASGEQRGVVRTQTSLLNSQRIGPISCLNFHPHRPLLATGSADSLVTMYPIEPMHKESAGTSALESESSIMSLKA
jgi:WD40 repeat protein